MGWRAYDLGVFRWVARTHRAEATAWPSFLQGYEEVCPLAEVDRRASEVPYPQSVIWISPDFLIRAGVQSINVFAGLFLVLVCGNVALLMFARAATCERELLVRTALGGTRGRITGLLFVEALVLATLAAVVGLLAASLLLRLGAAMMSSGSERWPFWFDGGLSSTTIVYAAVLTLLAAAVAGGGPAQKILGRGMWSRLHQSSSGGGGLRMGGVWTAVIVAQIAATVLFTAVAFVVHRQAGYIASATVSFPAEEYLSVRLRWTPRAPPARRRRTPRRRGSGSGTRPACGSSSGG